MGAIIPLKRDASTNLAAEPQAGDDGLVIGQATLDASGLTADRTLTLPDVDGAIALLSGATTIAVVSSLPGTPDANTIYLVTG